ncbi:hypothetical protein EDD18DRAFT_1073795, partial [Armillaria luteobubalina]
LDNIFRSAHGYCTIDALRKWCKITDEENLESKVVRFEEAILANASKPGGSIVAVSGVKKLLGGIQGGRLDQDQGWSVCMSCSASCRGLRIFNNSVTAESVKQGKPAADPYLRSAKLNEMVPSKSIAVEDAPTGIRSAGCFILATCTKRTHKSQKGAPALFGRRFG